MPGSIAIGLNRPLYFSTTPAIFSKFLPFSRNCEDNSLKKYSASWFVLEKNQGLKSITSIKRSLRQTRDRFMNELFPEPQGPISPTTSPLLAS